MTKCKNCQNEASSGIWVESQFKGNSPLLFCSEKCKKEFVKMKLERIKVNYPRYYEKVMKVNKNDRDNHVL